MKKLIIIIAMFVSSAPALAQQAQQSPMERALGGKLVDEINSNVQARAALAQAQDEIADLKKQLDAAKAKPAK